MTTNLLTLEAALEFLGVAADGGAGDELVTNYITAVTTALENICGPLVSRQLVAVDAGTTPTLEVAAGTSGRTIAELRRHVGVTECTIGTAADPWASVPACMIVGITWTTDPYKLSIATPDSAPFTVAAASGVRAGRYIDTDDVPQACRTAAFETLRNRWANEQGALSAVYDLNLARPAVPWTVPFAALEMLGDLVHGGAT